MAQPLVALQVRNPELADPAEMQAKAYNLRSLALQDQAAQQARADDQAARAAFSANPTDNNARLSALAGVSPAAYGAEAKRQADLAKSGAETRVKQLEAAHKANDLAGQAFSYVAKFPTLKNATDAINWLTQNNVYTPEQGAQYLDQVQKNPGEIKNMADGAFRQALEVKDQLMKFEKQDIGGSAQVLATDPVTGEVKVVSTTKKTQSPDSIASNERIASEGRLNRANTLTVQDRITSRDKTQLLQTDNGPVLVNKATGETRPVTSEGQPLAARAKEVPAAIKKAMFENNAALRKIDDALTAIDAYPQALGGMNILGDTIRQRTDPEGIKARALVADIGSLKLHDRSGAAVTASETPRLKPFIPTATDNPDTVRQKLELFKREYQALQEDMLAAYPSAAAQRRPTAKPTPAAAAIPNTNAQGWTLHTDAQGNRAYVSPDGKQFKEVP